jgi:hypothetical protein
LVSLAAALTKARGTNSDPEDNQPLECPPPHNLTPQWAGNQDSRPASVFTGKLMTSFPMLNANKLSYCEKASMVRMYSLRREVVHAGEARLIDPLRGRETSSLFSFGRYCSVRRGRGQSQGEVEGMINIMVDRISSQYNKG